MLNNRMLMFRCETKTPTRIKEIAVEKKIGAEVVVVNKMTGVDAIVQISIPILGAVGSLASIIALWREYSQSSETKVTHIVFIKDGQKVSEQNGSVSEDQLEKFVADLLDNEE